MDFPIFHLDWMNNRLLIGVIAVIHVLINHPLAVGGLALIAVMERKGIKTGSKAWDDLAYKVLFFCFIITTTVGAMTGVGIWFSAGLVNPMAIGSLIRVFFWGWFTEWIIFVLEVSSIMLYFLTWKSMQGDGLGSTTKARHNRIGIALAVFSWLTMAIIVAILGFMMDPGNWMADRSFITGVFNPLYLPQLAFRTPFAMVTAGLATLFLSYFFIKKSDPFRQEVVKFISQWVLCWLPLLGAGSVWYWFAVPNSMLGNLKVAMGTQAFADWHNGFAVIIAASLVFILTVALWGLFEPDMMPRAVFLVPFILALGTLSYFERVREFIRKPYVIGEYLYANGLRVEDYALFKRDGILAHSTFVRHREITPENEIEAGEDVFMIACTRCHTVGSLNSITAKLDTLYGDEWAKDKMMAYFSSMHNARPYMPPFPGNERELEALASYLTSLKENPRPLYGAQDIGVDAPELQKKKLHYGSVLDDETTTGQVATEAEDETAAADATSSASYE